MRQLFRRYYRFAAQRPLAFLFALIQPRDHLVAVVVGAVTNRLLSLVTLFRALRKKNVVARRSASLDRPAFARAIAIILPTRKVAAKPQYIGATAIRAHLIDPPNSYCYF